MPLSLVKGQSNKRVSSRVVTHRGLLSSPITCNRDEERRKCHKIIYSNKDDENENPRKYIIVCYSDRYLSTRTYIFSNVPNRRRRFASFNQFFSYDLRSTILFAISHKASFASLFGKTSRASIAFWACLLAKSRVFSIPRERWTRL